MTTLKITVSVPRETLERAKRAMRKERATSLSAYVSTALEEKSTLDELDILLNEMLDETGGPMTRAETARVDAVIRGPARSKKK